MRQHNTTAIILRRINYGEADRILTILTKDQGKLSVIAKGARRSKSKLAGGLELFCVSQISYIDGKSDLKTVISTRLERNYGNIVEDINVTMTAYDFLKSIDTATQETCESEYFDLLDNALMSLNHDLENLEIIRAWFSVKLLGLRGVSVNLEHQVSGSEFDDASNYNFSFDDMGFFALESGQYLPKHIKFLRLMNKVSKPENILKVSDAAALAKDLNPLLDHCLKF